MATRNFTAIIPTFNEEAWLPRLLASLNGQDTLARIIVADNNSTDRTVEFAQSADCQVVRGGRPAAGRNIGASYARTPFLLFADADCVVPPGLLSSALHTFEEKTVVAVHYPLVPITDKPGLLLLFRAMDAGIQLLGRCDISIGVAGLMAVRHSTFKAVGGFDQAVSAAEDALLFRQLSEHGRIVYDRTLTVPTSPRRFNLESSWAFTAKSVVWAGLRILGSRASVIDYRWTTYPAAWAMAEQRVVDTKYLHWRNRDERRR